MTGMTQPNEYTIRVLNHGEPTLNKPQSASVYFDSEPNIKNSFDLGNLADTQDFDQIQTIFIDNYGNDGDVIITIDDTQQRIVCKKNLQGYFPLLAYKRLKFSVMHTGTGKKNIPIFLLNFIVSQGAW